MIYKKLFKTKKFASKLFGKNNFCSAQIEMGETIAVLFIFFILLIGGLVFYYSVAKGTVERDIEEKSDLDAIDVVQKMSYLPELSCTSHNVPTENCIDLLKMQSMQNHMSDDKFMLSYYDKFLFSHIFVVQVYPPATQPGEESSWTIYKKLMTDVLDGTPPVTVTTHTNNVTMHVPVTIFDATGDDGAGENYYGVLVVEVFS